jgi:hypothetical protein
MGDLFFLCVSYTSSPWLSYWGGGIFTRQTIKTEEGYIMGFSRKTYSGQTGVDQGDRLPMDSTNKPFYFVHSPLSWSYVETQYGWELLPNLNAVQRQAGVGGMKMVRGGDGVDSLMWQAEKTTKEKAIIIPMDYSYNGEKGYMTQWKNRHGHPYYTHKWIEPQQVGNKVVWVNDDNGFHDFKRDLVHQDLIPPPHEVTVEKLKQSLTRRIERRINAASHNADVKARKDALEHQLSLIDQAFENLKAKKLPKKTTKKASA